MTLNNKLKKTPLKNGRVVISIALILATFCISVTYSDDIAEFIKSGLTICIYSIIPSVFPFMLIADIISKYGRLEEIQILRKIFEKQFKINGAALSAFVIGAVCGFPLGAKRAVELYNEKSITKEECERLIGFSNNTGPSFLICGIGYLMRGSIKDGVILYVVMIVSAILIGTFFSLGKKHASLSTIPVISNYSFTDSVKSSVNNTLYICGFVALFSAICGFIKDMLGESVIYYALISFTEVGNSASILSKSSLLNYNASMILTAFATSFSGCSVHLQTLSFLAEAGISTIKYFIMKLLQGICAALLCSLFLFLL